MVLTALSGDVWSKRIQFFYLLPQDQECALLSFQQRLIEGRTGAKTRCLYSDEGRGLENGNTPSL